MIYSISDFSFLLLHNQTSYVLAVVHVQIVYDGYLLDGGVRDIVGLFLVKYAKPNLTIVYYGDGFHAAPASGVYQIDESSY